MGVAMRYIRLKMNRYFTHLMSNSTAGILNVIGLTGFAVWGTFFLTRKAFWEVEREGAPNLSTSHSRITENPDIQWRDMAHPLSETRLVHPEDLQRLERDKIVSAPGTSIMAPRSTDSGVLSSRQLHGIFDMLQSGSAFIFNVLLRPFLAHYQRRDSKQSDIVPRSVMLPEAQDVRTDSTDYRSVVSSPRQRPESPSS